MKVLVWKARSDRNLTLKELEQMTGISKSTLQRIENEGTSPTLEKLSKIAKALNVRISELYEEDSD